MAAFSVLSIRTIEPNLCSIASNTAWMRPAMRAGLISKRHTGRPRATSTSVNCSFCPAFGPWDATPNLKGSRYATVQKNARTDFSAEWQACFPALLLAAQFCSARSRVEVKDLKGILRCDLELRSPKEAHQLTSRRKVSEREQMFAAGLSNLYGEGTPIIPVVAWLQIGLSFENS